MPALPTSISAGSGAAQPDALDLEVEPAVRPPPDLDARAERLHRGERRAGVGGVEVVARSGSAPSPIAAEDRRAVGDRLVGRRAQLAAQRAGGREAASRARDATLTRWPSPRTTSAARSASLGCRRSTARSRRCAHVGGRVERHVLDVDAGVTEGERDLGDGAGPVLDADAKLGERARRRARTRAGNRRSSRAPRCQRSMLLAVTAAQQPASLLQALDDAVDLAATASPLAAKMSRPERRVGARHAGRVAEARADLRAGARRLLGERLPAWETSTSASTCGRWLTVAITRSWVSASIACGRAPSSAIARCRRS